MDIISKLSQEFNLKPDRVEATVNLIDEGNTIPFIARYRKEITGSLDDQVLRELSERLTYLRNLNENREKVFNSISEQGAMTEEIAAALENAETMTEIDDIYRPYRPKRKTRASVAKAKGLEGLANMIYEQPSSCPSPLEMAADFINEELGVNSAEEALQGAMDIIAEMISDDADIRKRLRYVCYMNGNLTSRGNCENLGVYETYKEYTEPLNKVAGHRTLAINRGEREDILKVSIDFDAIKAMNIILGVHLKNESSPCADVIRLAAEDAYGRLIFPSIEREIRNMLTEKADTDAIKLFAKNLRQLLMQAPVKGKIVLGLDPGYRMGCKTAVVDETGKVLDTGVIYPVPPFNKIEQAKAFIAAWIKKYKVQIIAIGNGTASHETEVFAADVIKDFPEVKYMVVSEAGASVYSASKLAAEEFPEFDVNLRSAVSIARRLQDPLAELVKIDPKAIGVGQYQHDMPQNQLSEALDGVVEDCVNSVGVDINTASAPLLSRVAGINSTVAKNIVTYREENGCFESREELKRVPKLGPKAFLQCAGFMRVPESENLLDNTSVHPESYSAAEALLKECGLGDKEVSGKGSARLYEIIEEKGAEKLSEKLGIGVPTLLDIVKELSKPGRDPRDELPPPMLRSDVLGIESLTPGMELKGTVRNVVDFGAFVDIGVHQDGLVHISQISKKRVNHPSDILSVGDIVTVWVLSVDIEKKRIALTMRKPEK